MCDTVSSCVALRIRDGFNRLELSPAIPAPLFSRITVLKSARLLFTEIWYHGSFPRFASFKTVLTHHFEQPAACAISTCRIPFCDNLTMRSLRAVFSLGFSLCCSGSSSAKKSRQAIKTKKLGIQHSLNFLHRFTVFGPAEVL